MDSKVITVVPTGTKLSITGTVYKGFRFVSYGGKGRWVRNQYLSDKKPAPPRSPAAGGISAAACSKGSKVESGLTRDAIRVHRALCARYPADQLVRRDAVRRRIPRQRPGGGLHDLQFLRGLGHGQLGAGQRQAPRGQRSHLLQKIWTVQRGSEGWRGMSDRGSATANHYDHVHVSVYGNRGTG
jgi:hypothetical protein